MSIRTRLSARSLVVLRQPLPHLGRAHANHGIVAGLVIRAAAEHFGPDDPFAKQIVFSGERVLDHIPQKSSGTGG